MEKRDVRMDLLRISACFMVVLLHTSAQNWDAVPYNSADWLGLNFYNAAVRCAVAIFFMISGKLFLSRETLSVKKLLTKNVLRLVLIYVLWSVLYAVDTMGLRWFLEGFDLHRFLSAVIGSKYHLWYLPELAAVYLMLPVLFALKSWQGGRMLRYICIMVFVFTILKASALMLTDSVLLADAVNKVKFPIGSCCGYFVLGYVLEQEKARFARIRTWVLVLAYVGLTGITAAAVYLDSAAKGAATSRFYNDIFLSNYLAAIVLFLLFLRLPVHCIGESAAGLARKANRYTLFVYLFHPFVLEHLRSIFSLHSMSFSPWLSVPVIAGAAFAISMGTAWVINRLPGIRRILL